MNIKILAIIAAVLFLVLWALKVFGVISWEWVFVFAPLYFWYTLTLLI